MRKIAPAYPTQILSAQNAPVTENGRPWAEVVALFATFSFLATSLVSAEVPETVLLREILYAYQGIDGKHIHWDETKGQFNVDAAV